MATVANVPHRRAGDDIEDGAHRRCVAADEIREDRAAGLNVAPLERLTVPKLWRWPDRVRTCRCWRTRSPTGCVRRTSRRRAICKVPSLVVVVLSSWRSSPLFTSKVPPGAFVSAISRKFAWACGLRAQQAVVDLAPRRPLYRQVRRRPRRRARASTSVPSLVTRAPDISTVALWEERLGGHRLPFGTVPLRVGRVDQVEAALTATSVNAPLLKIEIGLPVCVAEPASWVQDALLVRVTSAGVRQRPSLTNRSLPAVAWKTPGTLHLERTFISSRRVVILAQFAASDVRPSARGVQVSGDSR